MRKVFIPGGSGFIGGRLSQKLSYSSDIKVSIGSRKIKPEVFLGLRSAIRIDYECKDGLKDILKGVDVVIYAAGMNADQCARNGPSGINDSLVGFQRFVDAAFEVGVKKFIYLSSAHVYASPLKGRYDEDSPVRNTHCYAQLHSGCEKILLNKSGSMQNIILRLSNIYGSPADHNAKCWHLLINDLCSQAAIKDEIVLKSSGKQKRDFLSMADVCEVIERVVRADINDKYIVINVGSGISRGVIEIANLIKLKYREFYKRDLNIKIPDITTDVEFDFEYSVELLKSMNFYSNNFFDIELTNLIEYCRNFR